MAKNNCCKICGRLDYDDNGEYLICRVCGEKRRKYRVPWIEFILCALFIFCGGYSMILAILARVYRTDSESNAASIIKPPAPNENQTGDFHPFDVFMRRNEAHLIWIEPLFWVIAIAFIVLAVYFFRKMRETAKKKII